MLSFIVLKPSATVFVLAILAMLSTSLAAAAAEQELHDFDLPAQSLNNALLEFAAEAKLELIFGAELVRGLQAAKLQGRMTGEQALTLLLQRSGLSYRFIDQDTVTLVKHEAATPAAEPVITQLQPVIVTDERSNQISITFDGQVVDTDPKSYRAETASSASRTNTPLKQIPQSVQTIKRSLIDDQKNFSVSESLYNVSSVVPRNILFTPVIEGTLIRGFRAEQLLDGFSQYYNPGDRESTVNLQRIEVLKGGNAVLYGGGSGSPVGGVVNLLSKLPEDRAFGEFGYTQGSHEFHQPYFDWNQPLNAMALFRISGEYTNSASYVDSLDTRRFNINPSLSLNFSEATRLNLQGKVSRWRQQDYQGLPASGTIVGTFRIRPSSFIGPDDIADSYSDADSLWGSLEHTLNSNWSLNLKGRYAHSEFEQNVQSLFGSDGFVADRPLLPPSTWALVNAQLYQRQQEHSLLGNAIGQFSIGSSNHTLLLGADYSDLKDTGFINADLIGSGTVDLQSPHFPLNYQPPGSAINSPTVSNITYGGYLQLQSALFKRFHQLFSLRLGGMEIDYSDNVNLVGANTQTLKLLPRLGSVFDLTDEISLFASYGEGMRGQPFTRFSGQPQPELSRQVEAGFKFDIDKRISGQLALYQIDRSQVAVADGSSLSFSAKGEQRSRGIETDLIWQASDAFSLLANYAHTEAEFVDALAGVAKGNTLAMVPEDSGRLWANYRFQQPQLQGLSIGFGVYLRSKAYLSNDNRYQAPGYHSFDATISYERQSFRLAASAKNLSDADYFQPYGYFAGRVAPDAGPAVFVSASVRF